MLVCVYRISFDLAPLVKFPKSNDGNPVYVGIPWQKKHSEWSISGLESLYLAEITTSRSVIQRQHQQQKKMGFCCKLELIFLLLNTVWMCLVSSGVMTVSVARKGLTPALQCYTSYTGFSPPLCLCHPSKFSLLPFPLCLPTSLWQQCSGLVTLRNQGSSP